MRSPSLLLSLLSLTLLASANAAPVIALHPEAPTLLATRQASTSDLGPSRFAHSAESYKRDQHRAHPAPVDNKASFRDTAESYKREASIPLAASLSHYEHHDDFAGRDDGRALDAGDQGGRFGKGAWFGAGSYKRDPAVTSKPKGASGAGGKAGWRNSGSDYKRDEVEPESDEQEGEDKGKFGKAAWANSGGDFKRAEKEEQEGGKFGKAEWANSGGDFKRSEGGAREHGGREGRADCGGRGAEACM